MISLLLVWLTAICQLCASVDLEAEDGSHSGAVHSRSEASGSKTVYIHQYGYVENTFLTTGTCTVSVINVVYSNDGGSDTITLSIDGTTVGSFNTLAESNGGQLWNTFRSSGSVGSTLALNGTDHSLRLVATSADQYGVELDKSVLNVACQQNTLTTTAVVPSPTPVVCISSTPLPNVTQCETVATIQQKSTNTTCAEEDNIHIPIFYPEINRFNITASLPSYFPNYTTANNRDADFSGCTILSSRLIWKIKVDNDSANVFDGACQGNVYIIGQSAISSFCQRFTTIGQEQTIVFTTLGISDGSVQASIGSVLTIKFAQITGSLVLCIQVYGRTEVWLNRGNFTFTSMELEQSVQIPDLTWSEAPNGNKIKIEVVGTGTFVGVVDFLKLDMRKETGETVYPVHNDGNVIVEAINIDFWWLYPQSMKLVNLVNGLERENVSYFRIYKRIPNMQSFSQLFVLYQDGNARILTFPPAAYDWIPFGSSVIIGPTNSSLKRPYASISKVDIHPVELYMIVNYTSGGSARIELKSSLISTKVLVSEIDYFTDDRIPFTTIRSMWVTDGNSDVDRVSNESVTFSIIDKWDQMTGTNFSFHRSCISKHNTLSPDIRIIVNCVMPSSLTSSRISSTYTFVTPAVSSSMMPTVSTVNSATTTPAIRSSMMPTLSTVNSATTTLAIRSSMMPTLSTVNSATTTLAIRSSMMPTLSTVNSATTTLAIRSSMMPTLSTANSATVHVICNFFLILSIVATMLSV